MGCFHVRFLKKVLEIFGIPGDLNSRQRVQSPQCLISPSLIENPKKIRAPQIHSLLVVLLRFAAFRATTTTQPPKHPSKSQLSLEAVVVVKKIHEKTTTTPNFRISCHSENSAYKYSPGTMRQLLPHQPQMKRQTLKKYARATQKMKQKRIRCPSATPSAFPRVRHVFRISGIRGFSSQV